MKKIISLIFFIGFNCNAFELNESSDDILRDTLFDLTHKGKQEKKEQFALSDFVKKSLISSGAYAFKVVPKALSQEAPTLFLISYDKLHDQLDMNGFYVEVRAHLKEDKREIPLKDFIEAINERFEYLEEIMTHPGLSLVSSDYVTRKEAMTRIAEEIFVINNIINQPEPDPEVIRMIKDAMEDTW